MKYFPRFTLKSSSGLSEYVSTTAECPLSINNTTERADIFSNLNKTLSYLIFDQPDQTSRNPTADKKKFFLRRLEEI